MFVIITYNDLKLRPIVNPNDVDDIYNGYTLWVSQFLLQKWYNLSDRYFENVRSKYKMGLSCSQKPIYLERPILTTNIWNNYGYILEDSNANWRWMSCDGYFYDYDCIPKRYRKILPYKEELFAFARSAGNNTLNKHMIYNHIQSELTMVDYQYFIKCGFDNDLSDKLGNVTGGVRFVVWVARYNLHMVYGFDNSCFYDQCLEIFREAHIEWLSKLSSEELEYQVQTAPDDRDSFYTFILRLCGKRRRKTLKCI